MSKLSTFQYIDYMFAAYTWIRLFPEDNSHINIDWLYHNQVTIKMIASDTKDRVHQNAFKQEHVLDILPSGL